MAQSQEAWDHWYAKNSEVCKARSRAHYAANKERHLANAKRYRQTNLEGVRAARLKWVAANPVKKLLAALRNRAKKNGLQFELTISDIVIPEKCPVLGIPIIMQAGKQDDCSPSVDRIDNSRGYVRGNVVVVSWRANRLKSDATPQELALLAAFYDSLATLA